MKKSIRRLVRQRARLRCEYCGLPEADCPMTSHHVEHIVARKHHGQTCLPNLALACHRCNFHKATDLSGLDAVTGKLTKLFHPRRHRWMHHFRWNGYVIVGRTAIGRTSVDVLRMNEAERIRLRKNLAEFGRFPW